MTAADRDRLLADVDAFCQEVRPHEELCYVEHRFNDQVVPLGKKHNILGMLNLLEWLPTVSADRLIIASTCAVYGEPDRQPMDESTAEMPTSPYGSSKLAADRAAADLAATGSIGAISLRAFAIAGASHGRPDHDETRLIPKLLAVQQGRAPEITINGDGAAIRDFVHVQDMANAFAAALDGCDDLDEQIEQLCEVLGEINERFELQHDGHRELLRERAARVGGITG